MPTPDFYQQRAAGFKQQHDQVESTIKQHAWSRVVLVVLIGLLGYVGFSNSLFFWPLPLILAAFIFLIKRQTVLEEKKKLLFFYEKLNREEAKGLLFKSTKFSEGSSFLDPHHTYAHDLDLFGKDSLFQYLDRCGTELGEARLARDLKSLNYSIEELKERQIAVQELSTQLEFRQHVWSLGKQIRESTFDQTQLLDWLTEKPFILGTPVFTILRWGLPALTLSVLALVVYDFSYYPAFILMMIVQIAIAGIQAKQIGDLQRKLSKGKDALTNYSLIFEQLAKQKFEFDLMKHHHQVAVHAYEKVDEFSKLVNALESRMNPIAMMFGNGLFLYDFHAVSRVEKWRERYGVELPQWLESLAAWDALLSPATLHYNYPNYAFASFTNANSITGKNVGHPLISDKERVANDVELGNPATVMLITGANMAGKSTFLRTLGVNYVLGGLGAPVCATKWSMPLIELRSGMRTADSLQDHQSYFYAELYRLQSIMHDLRMDKPMFILLDEILKGTNSTDKQAGSRELIKQLKDLKALVVLATHDIALGDLESHYKNQITNACFEGNIENDQLTFDYTLHKGVAQKANATFLMQKMGIIPTRD